MYSAVMMLALAGAPETPACGGCGWGCGYWGCGYWGYGYWGYAPAYWPYYPAYYPGVVAYAPPQQAAPQQPAQQLPPPPPIRERAPAAEADNEEGGDETKEEGGDEMKEKEEGSDEEKKEGDEGKSGQENQLLSRGRQAMVIVTLPADARLYVDGKLLSTSSRSRVFTTPHLPGNTRHSYLMTAEVKRGGEVETQTHKVVVQGGRRTLVNFNFTSTSVAER